MKTLNVILKYSIILKLSISSIFAQSIGCNYEIYPVINNTTLTSGGPITDIEGQDRTIEVQGTLTNGEALGGIPRNDSGGSTSNLAWFKSNLNNPLVFNINLGGGNGIVNGMKLYSPWGFDEQVKDIKVILYNNLQNKLYEGNFTLPKTYYLPQFLRFDKSYDNVVRAEFIILSSWNNSSLAMKRSSILETVFINQFDDLPVISDITPSYQEVIVHKTPQTLSVIATKPNSNSAITYQWYKSKFKNTKSGTLIPGATNNSYTPDAKGTLGYYYYYVIVSNEEGTCSEVSNIATVKVFYNNEQPEETTNGCTYEVQPININTLTTSSTIFGDIKGLANGEGGGSTPENNNGGTTQAWYILNSNLPFNAKMNLIQESTIDGIRIYGAWGNNEQAQEVRITLYSDLAQSNLIFTKTLELTRSYRGALEFHFDQKIRNIKSARFEILSSWNDNEFNRTSIMEIALINSYDDYPVISKINNIDQTKRVNSPIDPIEIIASKYSNKTITYQWYKNTKNSNTGGIIIQNANSSTYTPPQENSVGKRYYYAILDNGFCKVVSEVAIVNDSENICLKDYKSGVSLKTNTAIRTKSLDNLDPNWPYNIPNGYLALDSSTTGMIITNMTTNERSLLSPVVGMIVFDTTLQKLMLYRGDTPSVRPERTRWVEIEMGCNE